MRIKIKKTKKFLTKLPLIVAKHAFWACLFLFFLDLLLGGLLFYKYSILAQRAELEDLVEPPLLNEKTYQQVLKVWQEQEQRFLQTDSKEYPDPFLESVPFPED